MSSTVFGQNNENDGKLFRIGERLSYSVSLDRFAYVAYAETYVESSGKLAEKDAVEISSRIKTIELASAAFYLVDEERTTFADPMSGFPLYSKVVKYNGVLPREYNYDFQASPGSAYDLNTLIYALRNAGQTGAMTLTEEQRTYSVAFQTTGNETIKSLAGEFDTSILAIQSDFLTERGISDLRINISTTPERIPVAYSFRTAKGEFRALIATIQMIEPLPDAAPSPTPVPVQTPRPAPTPQPTPVPYENNLPLSGDLPFVLGETLEFQITSNGTKVGSVVLKAAERTQFEGFDSLLLTATVTESLDQKLPANINDAIRVRVDPGNLIPKQVVVGFSGALSEFNETSVFDPVTGSIIINGTEKIDAPFGTHSLLSLLYAMRSFNLRTGNLRTGSGGPNSVNDTRVAVYFEGKTTVFSLRPSEPAPFDGPIAGMLNENEKASAQAVSITTGNPLLDALQPKVWLGLDRRRLPLRITLGAFQFDLVKASLAPLK